MKWMSVEDRPLKLVIFDGKNFIGGCHKVVEWAEISMPEN